MYGNEVNHHLTHRRVNRTTMGEINRRNAEYRDLKARQAQADELSVTTEAAWSNKLAAKEANFNKTLPIVVRKLTNEAYKVMPEIVLREYFTKLVTESLIWDKEDIEANMEAVRYVCHKYISAIGGLEAVREAAAREKSDYLAHVADVCMEAGKKIAKAKADKLAEVAGTKKGKKAHKEPDGDEGPNPTKPSDHDGDEWTDAQKKAYKKGKNHTEPDGDEGPNPTKASDGDGDEVKGAKPKAKRRKTVDEKDLSIDFRIPREENNDLDKKIKDLDVDSLSDMVKDKVLTVVKDENDKQAKDDTFIKDLKASINAIENDPVSNNPTDKALTDANGDMGNNDNADYGADAENVTGADTGNEGSASAADSGTAANVTAEAFTKYVRGGKINTQHSLFRSMVARSYRWAVQQRAVKETANVVATVRNNEETDDDYLKTALKNQPNNINIYDIYLNDGGDDLSYIDYVKNSDEIALAGDDAGIDNDEILSEALLFYTVIECANTIKLIHPSQKEIRNMVAHNEKA